MLPKAAIERVARKAGVDRISQEAIRELQITIEDLGIELAREIAHAAKHAGRKTIIKDDVLLVAHKK